MLLISVIDYEEVDTNRWNFVLHTALIGTTLLNGRRIWLGVKK